MKQLLSLILLLFMLTAASQAQVAGIKGTVTDTASRQVIKKAVIALLTQKDSILYRFKRSDATGSFAFANIKPGKYILLITHPLFADYTEEVEVKNDELQLGAVPMTNTTTMLAAVILKSGAPIRIKGDTTIYTADSFKVGPNANLAALLNKMPAISVSKDGKVTAMGEVVEKILVDGEEFFGSDPGLVSSTLRADAVKTVEVFNRKSDQAVFTGIDDGKISKTINIKLKEDKKKGYFGKAELAGGLRKEIDNRYNNSLLLNSFRGSRKLAFYGLMGNLGNTQLGWSDAEKYGGGYEDAAINDGGGNPLDIELNPNNGFSRNWNTGVHYSNRLNENNSINSGFKYNKLNFTTGTSSFSQTFLPDTTFFENNSDRGAARKENYRLNLTYDLRIDSMNSLKLTGIAGFIQQNAVNELFTEALNKLGNKVNNSSRTVSSDMDKKNINTTLLWRRKFSKASRTLSVNTDFVYAENTMTGFLLADNSFFDNGLFQKTDTLDQYRKNRNNSTTLSSRIAYTEPLAKNFYAEISYTFTTSSADNNRNTFSKGLNGKYEQQVDSLSNNFQQTVITNRAGVVFKYAKKKLSWSFGSAIANSAFDLLDKTLSKDYKYNFFNVFPQASLTYTGKGNRRYSVNYNGSTRQPSIYQLQPLRENNDPLNIYTGNPLLKQAFSHQFRSFFNHFNMAKNMYNFISFNAGFTQNAITNNVTLDANGRRTTTPTNTNGVHNASLSASLGYKIKKWAMTVGLNPSLGIFQNVDFINAQRNRSNTFNGGLAVDLSKGKEDKYELRLTPGINYSSNRSSLRSTTVSFFTWNAGADATWYITKSLALSSDCNASFRQKTSEFDRQQNNIIWNSELRKNFASDVYSLKLGVYDILNQNNNYNRENTSNKSSEVFYSRLQRYWMLAFSWNFSKNKPKNDY
jgi:Outer membrane protein beta-barrel family/Carboxypeptidase regulatory-like domain